jgi:hypothetical protein
LQADRKGKASEFAEIYGVSALRAQNDIGAQTFEELQVRRVVK